MINVIQNNKSYYCQNRYSIICAIMGTHLINSYNSSPSTITIQRNMHPQMSTIEKKHNLYQCIKHEINCNLVTKYCLK